MYIPIVSPPQPAQEAPQKDRGPPWISPINIKEVVARLQQLKTVSPSALPERLGGPAEPAAEDDEHFALRNELLAKSRQIRAQLARHQLQRHEDDRLQRRLEAELQHLTLHESPMRPKYELDRLVQSQPGWTDLQAEVRQRSASVLDPVCVNDFYVVHSARHPI